MDPREALEAMRRDREQLQWTPLDPAGELDAIGSPPLSDAESLHYLHHHWQLSAGTSAALPGGLRGRILRLAARVVDRVTAPRLAEERELLANMVRLHEETARRLDALVARLADRQVAEAENLAELSAWLHGARLDMARSSFREERSTVDGDS